MLYELSGGKIIGRYQQPQEGKTLLPESNAQVKKALAAEEEEAQAKADAKAAYLYAKNRMREYIAEFSKDPDKNVVDAIGHVLDALVDAFYGDAAALDMIKEKRDAIKARNPK